MTKYLKRKKLLESQGWYAISKMGETVVFVKGNVNGLYIQLNCFNGNDTVFCGCPKDYFDKHMPILEEEEND